MSNIAPIYDKIIYAIDHIEDTVKDKKSQGKKVIGVIPPYIPEELIHAAGMFPIGCWGAAKPLSAASTYLPSFACSIAAEITELAAEGYYNILDGIMISCACDTLKCTGQNLTKICKNTEIIFCRYPQHNNTEAGKIFLMEELRSCKSKLEAISGQEITDKALYDSIEVYNQNREALMEFVSLTAKSPGIVNAEMRQNILKARFYMDREAHTLLVRQINDELNAIPAFEKEGTNVYLAGIIAEPPQLLNIFDELNINIVGDELIQGTRQFRTPVPEGIDQLERLADHWAQIEGCAFTLDIGKKRAAHIAQQAKESGAKAVIFLQLMFCDVDEFDYPYIRKAVTDAGLPILNVEVQQNMISLEQIRTRLQAFCEML